MGGRCSGTARIFGTALKLKPIIRVLDNKDYVDGSIRFIGVTLPVYFYYKYLFL